MSEPLTPKHSQEIENALDSIYTSFSADPAFASRLGSRLAARAAELQRPAPARRTFPAVGRHGARRLAIALAFTMFGLILLVSLIGPQQVLAEVQRLLGYAPGVGFVQPGATRLLAAPVEVSQGEVTLRIETVVADASQTQVNLTARGLPHTKFGPAEGGESKESQPYLLLPDGSRLAIAYATTGIGDILQATLSFPPLPAGVEQISLALPRLPSLPAGYAPENWIVPLSLQVAGSAAAATAPGLPLAQPYTPANASVSMSGVTARLLQVGQSSAETGLEVQFNWSNPDWLRLTDVQAQLSDDASRSYERRLPALGPAFEPRSPASAPASQMRLFRFAPLDPQARTGVLVLTQLDFSFASRAQFTFNLGRPVQVGQSWDLSGAPGNVLDIAGQPVQVLSAALSDAQPESVQNGSRYLLSVEVQALPQNGQAISSLALSLRTDRVSSSCESLPGGRFRLSTGLTDLPAGPLTLHFPSGDVILAGPLTIEWELPKSP